MLDRTPRFTPEQYGEFLRCIIHHYDDSGKSELNDIRKDLRIIMADLKATRDELASLVPIVQEIAGDINELDVLVKQLQEQNDPAVVDEIATLAANLKASLRAAADVVPEAAEPPVEPEPVIEPAPEEPTA